MGFKDFFQEYGKQDSETVAQNLNIDTLKQTVDIFGNLRQGTSVGNCGVRPLLAKNRTEWNACVEKQANQETTLKQKNTKITIIVIGTVLALVLVFGIIILKKR